MGWYVIVVLCCCAGVRTQHFTHHCLLEVDLLIKQCMQLKLLGQMGPLFQNNLRPSGNVLKHPFGIQSKMANDEAYCRKFAAVVQPLVESGLADSSEESADTYEERYSFSFSSMEDSLGDETESTLDLLIKAALELWMNSTLQDAWQISKGSRSSQESAIVGFGDRSAFNESNKVGNRIIGGRVVQPREIPYQVALYKLEVFLCGSSLISQYFVLTAAHCLQGVLPNELWFRVGSDSLIKGGQTYQVADFAVHENYANFDYDIALIRAGTPVKFGPSVKPIKLPSKKDGDLLPGTPTLASGWSDNENSRDQPAYRLREVELKIASRQQCRNRAMTSIRSISNRQICTTAPARVSTCFGDAGGPLVAKGKLVGIVSWGSPCAIGDPDVYTNVHQFLPWIYQKMNRLNNNANINSAPKLVYSSYSYLPDFLLRNLTSRSLLGSKKCSLKKR